jgi:flagellar biosynthesis/type III secretory pathway M-ring protein FliF/YscJ
MEEIKCAVWWWALGGWVVGMIVSPLIIVWIARRLQKRIAKRAAAMVARGIMTPNEAREQQREGG